MAMGKAIVTTDSAGCREVVERGRNGYVVPSTDAAVLAHASCNSWAITPALSEFGLRPRLKVGREFSEAMAVRRALKEFYGIPQESLH
jgi:glycosyltransferase involved in cell wall biosynthesis